MKALAQFAMSGRRQAILAALILGFLPVFNFLSPPVVALVALRQGRGETLTVLLWVALPALGWFVLGDMMPLMTLLGTVVLALILRSTGSWQFTLLASVGVGMLALLGFSQQTEMFDLLETQFTQSAQQVVNSPGFEGQLNIPGPERLHELMLMAFSASVTAMTVTLLMLARSWQAKLYNPGGFREEFHALRLDWRLSVVLFALYLLSDMGVPVLPQMKALFVLPLMIAGVALVHGLVGRRKLPVSILVIFYSVMVFPAMLQLVGLAALADSWFDFRSKVPARD